MTKPYFGFVQRYYFFLGLVQLIFMILFSVHYIPDTCTLASVFSDTTPHCNLSTSDAASRGKLNVDSISDAASGINFTVASAVPRESANWLWLTWPVFIFVGSTTDFFVRFVWNTAVHLARYAHNSFAHDRSGLKVLKRLSVTVWPTKLLLAAANSFPLISFCISVFVWFHRHSHGDDRQQYLEALSMVFLFGWMVDFVLFSGITEHLYVFLLVLNEIIVQVFFTTIECYFVKFTDSILLCSLCLHFLHLIIVFTFQ